MQLRARSCRFCLIHSVTPGYRISPSKFGFGQATAIVSAGSSVGMTILMGQAMSWDAPVTISVFRKRKGKLRQALCMSLYIRRGSSSLLGRCKVSKELTFPRTFGNGQSVSSNPANCTLRKLDFVKFACRRRNTFTHTGTLFSCLPFLRMVGKRRCKEYVEVWSYSMIPMHSAIRN